MLIADSENLSRSRQTFSQPRRPVLTAKARQACHDDEPSSRRKGSIWRCFEEKRRLSQLLGSPERLSEEELDRLDSLEADR